MNRVLSVLALAAALPVFAADEAPKMVPLKLQLPKPPFISDAVPIRVPNLEKPQGRPRPDMMVPAGTILLSAGKKVASSDEQPTVGKLDYLTDGNKEGDQDSYVELDPMQQWMQIDLEYEARLMAIVVWHYHVSPRVYHDVIVQVSDDPTFQDGVSTLYNNDHDNSAGMGIGEDLAYIETNEGRLIDAKGAEGRYVRLYSRGNTANDMNHYVEAEVYGIPQRKAP